MSYTKTIACLANSRKPPSGRCIAGREIDGNRFGAWVRPVSVRSTQEISEEERRYENGKDPEVLDILAIEMIRAQPHKHQQENHVIEESRYWVKKGTVSWTQLQAGIENPAGPLWINGSSTTYGLNDKVPEEKLNGLTRSLYLIRPENLVLSMALEGGDFSPARRRLRARFELCGESYKIAVTDPVVERAYLAGKDGESKLDNALLCVSLGETYHGFAFKLAAAVITPRRAGA